MAIIRSEPFGPKAVDANLTQYVMEIATQLAETNRLLAILATAVERIAKPLVKDKPFDDRYRFNGD